MNSGIPKKHAQNLTKPTPLGADPRSAQLAAHHPLHSAKTADPKPDTFTMYFDNIFLASEISFVPEPGSGMLLGLGLLGLMMRLRRRQS